MESFKRFVRGAFDRGGVRQLIVGCLALYIQQYCPSILVPVSIGIISAGVFLFARYVIMDYKTKRENVRYEEFLRKLEERMPAIKEHLHSSEEHRECFFRIMLKSERLLEQLRDPSHLEDRITCLERLLQEIEKISSCATKTLETLKKMRKGQELFLATHSEEDTTVFNNVEYEGQTDAGKMQHEDEKRHENVFEFLLEEIKDAVQKEEIPQNVLNEISEKLLEHLSEDSLMRIVLCEKFQVSKKKFEKVLAFIVEQEEKVKNFLAMKVAHEVVGKWNAGEARMQEIFKHVFEEAVKKGLKEETPEEALGKEAAGEEEDKKIVKTMSAKVIAKAVLKEVAANKALTQEIVKNVLQEAAKDMPGKVVAIAVTPGKAPRKTTMDEVAEEVLNDRHLIEDVLEKLLVNVLTRENEQKEDEKQKLPVNLQENLEIEDGKIQKQHQENPQIISAEELHKNTEEEMNIEKGIEAVKEIAETPGDETTK